MCKLKTEILTIIRTVAKATGIPINKILGKRKRASEAQARQISYYLAHAKNYNNCEIGRVLKRDHTTVRHGIKKITEERTNNRTLDNLLRGLED